MDRTTLTRNLKPLERRGLLSITPGSDQRTREVALTNRGHSLLAQAIPLWEDAQSRVLENLGEGWRKELLEILAPLISRVQ